MTKHISKGHGPLVIFGAGCYGAVATAALQVMKRFVCNGSKGALNCKLERTTRTEPFGAVSSAKVP